MQLYAWRAAADLAKARKMFAAAPPFVPVRACEQIMAGPNYGRLTTSGREFRFLSASVTGLSAEVSYVIEFVDDGEQVEVAESDLRACAEFEWAALGIAG